MAKKKEIDELRETLSKESLMDSSDKFFKSLIKKYLKDNRTLFHIASFYYGRYLFLHTRYEESLIAIQPVIVEYSAYPFIEEYPLTLNLEGLIWNEKRNVFLGLKFLTQAEELSLQHRCFTGLPKIYSNMSVLYKVNKDYPNCLDAIKKSFKYLPYVPKGEESPYFINLASAYIRNKKYDDALVTLNTVIKDFDAYSYPDASALIDVNYYIIYRMTNRPEKADFFLNRIFTVLNKTEVNDRMIESGENLAEFFLENGPLDKFVQMIEILKRYSEGGTNLEVNYFIDQKEADYFEKMGDYKNGFLYLRRAQAYLLNNMKNVSEEINDVISEKRRIVKIERENDSSKKMNELLKIESITDQLTGLYNRHAYNQDMAKWKKNKNKDISIGCAFIDIDNFKSYNDRFGHLEGDKLLAIVGKEMLSFSVDGIKFYRYGGDEFLAFFQGKTEKEVTDVCKELQKNIMSSSLANGKEGITLSIGLYYSPDFSFDVFSFLDMADEALYKSKKTVTKGKIELYHHK